MASRVVLKMSGEAINDVGGELPISVSKLDRFAEQIRQAKEASDSLEIALVIGGGNIVRGEQLAGMDRTRADHMGMIATVINALALQDALDRSGLVSRVLTGIDMPRVAEPYIHGRALRHLDKGRVVIFAGGTGNPFFTTDMAAALRASEIHADRLLLAKFGTDGVYNADPNRSSDAEKYELVDYDVIIAKNLRVMDSEAVVMCRRNSIPIYVFDMEADDAITDALLERSMTGTTIAAVPVEA